MSLPITMVYAGSLGLLMAVLSIRVPMRRGQLDVPYGDGGDEALATRIRAFGNFTEYVPMLLILMGLLESSGTSPFALHGLGIGALSMRLLHAIAYKGSSTLSLPRKVGRGIAAMGTWCVLVCASVWVLLA